MYFIRFFKRFGIAIFVVFAICMFFKPVLCPFILGLLFSWLGLTGIWVMNTIQKKGVESTGRIFSFETDSDGDKTPLVEFTARETGQVIREKPFVYTTSDLSSYARMAGTDVPIRYNPDDPTQFMLGTDPTWKYVLFGIFTIIGFAAMIVSLGSLLGYIDIGF